MEKFSLEKWLKDKSRKVIDDNGFPVEIIKWDANEKCPVVYINHNGIAYNVSADGMYDADPSHGLFFADEEETTIIEIPYGAKDSEFIKDEYTIPEGCEARIEGNKVIIEKIQKENELTELQKTLEEDCDCYVNLYNDGKTREELREWIKGWCPRIIDLARKELLKDLPKWKKMPNGIQGNSDFNPTYLVRVSNGYYFTTPSLSWDKDSVYIELSELDKLPKEE